MYALAIRRDFIAQHYLIGGDWGAENELHSHHYQVEVELAGDELDQQGYLVDIVEVEKQLEALVARFQDQTLVARLATENVLAVTIRLWENENAWAFYRYGLHE